MSELIVEFDYMCVKYIAKLQKFKHSIGSVCALYRQHSIIRIIFFCNFATCPPSNPQVRIA